MDIYLSITDPKYSQIDGYPDLNPIQFETSIWIEIQIRTLLEYGFNLIVPLDNVRTSIAILVVYVNHRPTVRLGWKKRANEQEITFVQ